MRQGIGFSATLPTPSRERVSSLGTFTRSLAYRTSGGARGLNPRPITIHSGLSTCSSHPPQPPAQHPVLQFAFELPPLGPFICLSNGRTAQSVPPHGSPFFPSLSSPTCADPLLFSDYGNLVARGTVATDVAGPCTNDHERGLLFFFGVDARWPGRFVDPGGSSFSIGTDA